MRYLCNALNSNQHLILPSFYPISIAKIVSLITAKECNTELFLDIRKNIYSLYYMLVSNINSNDEISSNRILYQDILASTIDYKEIVDPLLILTAYESGININQAQLLTGTTIILQDIDHIIADAYNRLVLHIYILYIH